MSDLAPLVAATIKDKVVDDLVVENEKLQEALAATRCIRVMSHKQRFVFSTGSVENGRFHDNPNLWIVPLQSQKEPRIQDLKSFEIYLGGALLVAQMNSFYAGPSFEIFPGDEPHREHEIPMCFTFDGVHGTVYCHVVVKNCAVGSDVIRRLHEGAGLTQHPFSSFIKVLKGLNGNRQYTTAPGGMTVEFLKLVISVDRIAGIIDSLPLVGAEAERREAHQRHRKILRAVLEIMESEIENYDETDTFLVQYIGVVADHVALQGITDTESEEFRNLVLQRIP